mgnify:CR=1 FL=1
MGRLTERVINQVKKTKSHKKKKQTMKKKLFKTRLLSFAAFCGLTLAFASCANEDVAQNPNNTDNDKNLTTFTAGDPSTRTSMESDGKFFWEAGDKIYVKDDNGAWHASSNSPTGKTDNFKFKVPGTYTAHMSYEVYYPGQGSSNDQVVISANQSQAEPNTTAHFGAAGDCGMATATKVSGKQQFAFTLDHKAAYLLLLPRTSNTILHNCYLTKVEVNSDNDITSTYTLDPTTGKLTGTGTGKQIVLTTGGSGTYANGFPLTNNSTSAATNGSYVVIKPGTHTLKIRYWVKDLATNVEGTITKTLASATYDQNKYYNITANLDVKNYDGDHYYMWDAQQDYWAGHDRGADGKYLRGLAVNEIDMPNASPTTGSPRWYNPVYAYKVSKPATHSANQQPNVNLMCHWAIPDWDQAHWDSNKLWFGYGHLQKGGIWIRKRTSPPMVNKDWDFWGEDFRKNGLEQTYVPAALSPNNNASNNHYTLRMPLPAGQESNFFFLPASGYGIGNRMRDIGRGGHYWTSTPSSGSHTDYAFYFYFNQSEIHVRAWVRTVGSRIARFY